MPKEKLKKNLQKKYFVFETIASENVTIKFLC